MMTTAAQWLVILSGGWLIAVGALMFASPQTALGYLSKAASTNLINYLEISLRMISGLALVMCADSSEFPAVFLFSGLFVVATSAVLFCVPRKWHARYAVWWSKKPTAPYVRLTSPFALAAGVLLIYAVA